jgi:hypothetical protein
VEAPGIWSKEACFVLNRGGGAGNRRRQNDMRCRAFSCALMRNPRGKRKVRFGHRTVTWAGRVWGCSRCSRAKNKEPASDRGSMATAPARASEPLVSRSPGYLQPAMSLPWCMGARGSALAGLTAKSPSMLAMYNRRPYLVATWQAPRLPIAQPGMRRSWQARSCRSAKEKTAMSDTSAEPTEEELQASIEKCNRSAREALATAARVFAWVARWVSSETAAPTDAEAER